jgi:Cu-Zn family superoxide dismutase
MIIGTSFFNHPHISGIHDSPDDLGLGGHKDSLTTGHAGKRITCAVIGYSKKICKK